MPAVVDHSALALALIEASARQAQDAPDIREMQQAQVGATIALAHAVLAVVDRLDEANLAHQQEVMAYQAAQEACTHPVEERIVRHDIEGGRVVKRSACGTCGQVLGDAPS